MTYVQLATKHTQKITPRQSLHGKNKCVCVRVCTLFYQFVCYRRAY